MDRSLTVVVPTFNGERYLGPTLDSLAAQSEPVCVLVIDDGSEDDCADLADSHPVVTRVVRQRNRGVAAARNRGLALASTEFVAFMDQDDLWHERRASILLDLATETGAAAVATSEQVFASIGDHKTLVEAEDPRAGWPSHWVPDGGERDLTHGKLTGSDKVDLIDVPMLMKGAAFVTAAVMYQREAAIVAGGCAPFVKAADDHVLNINCARIFGPIPRIDRPAIFYRIHPAATSNKSPLVLSLLALQLALRHGRTLPAAPELGPNLEHLLSQLADQSELSRMEQLSALLTLSTPRATRARWAARWAKRLITSRDRSRTGQVP